jgi:hypothetical protein
LLKGELRVDREVECEEDRKVSGEDRAGVDTPTLDELGKDCDRKAEMKSGVAGTWIIGVFLYDRTPRTLSSMYNTCQIVNEVNSNG